MTPSRTEIRRYRDDVDASVDFLTYLRLKIEDTEWYTKPYFEWKIRNNPFGSAVSYLRFSEGMPAAHCSIVAKPANDEVLHGAILGELGDTHTHPDFQRQGHFSKIGRYVIDDFAAHAPEKGALIYGLPNENALPGWTRSIGCKQLDQLNISARARLPWRRLLRDVWRERRSRGYRFRAAPASGEDITRIWGFVSGQGWLVRKDAEWWRWRYVSSVSVYQTVALEHVAGGDTVGWVAWRVLRTRVPGIRRYVICDIVTVDPRLEAVALELVVRMAGPRNIVSGWFENSSPIARAAEEFGFEPVRNVPVIFADNSAFRAIQSGLATPRLSMGDTDVV